MIIWVSKHNYMDSYSLLHTGSNNGVEALIKQIIQSNATTTSN
jgi:hypothetical protein